MRLAEFVILALGVWKVSKQSKQKSNKALDLDIQVPDGLDLDIQGIPWCKTKAKRFEWVSQLDITLQSKYPS